MGLLQRGREWLTDKLLTNEGELVALIPLGAEAVTLTAMPHQEYTDGDETPQGLVQVRRRKLTICTDGSRGYGAVTPYLNMPVTIGTVEYSVTKIDFSAPPMVVLTLTRPETRELTRPGFRQHGPRRT